MRILHRRGQRGRCVVERGGFEINGQELFIRNANDMKER